MCSCIIYSLPSKKNCNSQLKIADEVQRPHPNIDRLVVGISPMLLYNNLCIKIEQTFEQNRLKLVAGNFRSSGAVEQSRIG